MFFPSILILSHSKLTNDVVKKIVRGIDDVVLLFIDDVGQYQIRLRFDQPNFARKVHLTDKDLITLPTLDSKAQQSWQINDTNMMWISGQKRKERQMF